MKLIDKLMPAICDVMEWMDSKSPHHLSGRIREKLNDVLEQHDRLDAAKDAVIEAAHKATCAWPGSGAFTMPALTKALAALEAVRDA